MNAYGTPRVKKGALGPSGRARRLIHVARVRLAVTARQEVAQPGRGLARRATVGRCGSAYSFTNAEHDAAGPADADCYLEADQVAPAIGLDCFQHMPPVAFAKQISFLRLAENNLHGLIVGIAVAGLRVSGRAHSDNDAGMRGWLAQ